jgi:hypothetical protein
MTGRERPHIGPRSFPVTSVGARRKVDENRQVEIVGNVTRYPDMARGTRRKSSDVADTVRQPVVTQIG